MYNVSYTMQNTNKDLEDILEHMRSGDYIAAADIFSGGERNIPDCVFIELYRHLPTTYTDPIRTYNPQEELVTDSLCAGAIRYVEIGLSLGCIIPRDIIDNVIYEYERERRHKVHRYNHVTAWDIPYNYLVSKGYITDISLENVHEVQQSNKSRKTDINIMD